MLRNIGGVYATAVAAVFKAALRQARYDYVIDLQGLTKSALVAWLAHTTPNGLRIAMANQTEGSGYEAPTRWVADKTVRLEPHVHAVQRSRLVCAAALGYTVQGPAAFGLWPAAGAASKAVAAPVQPSLGGNPFVPRKPVVALVHGTSRADKQWPVSSWVALGQRLNHNGFTVALAHGNAAELVTVLERVLEETSFKASDLSGQTVAFDGDRVRDLVAELARDADLSRFIL